MPASQVHTYPGKKISIHYDVKRCIHAGACARGLCSVFDPNRKPWIDPDAAEADEVAAVVTRCPTGALHFTRHDGGQTETVPDHNSVTVFANGPLLLRGDVRVLDADGNTLAKDTRVALCRCGAAKNKPFCDGSHAKNGFQNDGSLGDNMAKTVDSQDQSGTLEVTVSSNGSLSLKGAVELVSGDEKTRYTGNRMFLCRCGASQNKPFCDGSHAKVGFTDDS